jgi:hypothetical protein
MYRLSMVRVDAIGFIDFGVTSHNVIDQSMIINFEMKKIFEVKPSKILGILHRLRF